MSTGRHRDVSGQDALRGATPRPATEYGRAPVTPAEESSVEAIIARVVGELLGQRTASDESTIAARVHDETRSKTRGLRLTAGTLGAALVALSGWAISQVQGYGDSRAAAERAAIVAEQKAEEAKAHLEETRELAQGTAARVDGLERKIDQVLAAVEARP